MNRFLTSRLTAKTEIRQVEASRLADAAADAVDQAVARQWRIILQSLSTPIISHARQRALVGLLGILPAAKASVAGSLNRIATWGHRTARRNLHPLPLGYLKAATVSLYTPESLLLEDAAPPSGPGILELILRAIGGPDPGEAADLSPTAAFFQAVTATDADERRQSFMDLLFPPPPRETVDDIVYAKVNGRSWDQRLEHATRTSATPRQLAEIVAQGVAQGKLQQEIARDLLPVVDGVRSTARRIARTEGLRVAQEMQVRAWDGLGDMLLGYQVRAVLDERTRESHRLRNGVIYYREPKRGQLGLEVCPRPPLEADGTIAWNCLLPGNYVQGCFSTGFRARYSGQAVEIVCANGDTIRVTANHPVLSSKGFVAADMLNEGDDLACYIGGIDLTNDEEDRPVAVEEVFGAIERLGGIIPGRPARTEEFHGDAVSFNGDVDVVFAERKLVESDDAQSGQFRDHFLLIGRGVKALAEAGQGTRFFSRLGVDGPLSCFVSRRDLGFPLERVCDPTPFGLFGLGLAADHDASGDQFTVQGRAADPDLVRQLVERIASKVPLLNPVEIGDRDGLCKPSRFSRSSQSDTELHQPLPDGVALDATLAAQSGERNAGTITTSKIVEIRRFHYDGPVYDFETDAGYYLCSSIVVQNCRCTLSPVLAPPDYLDASALNLFKDAESELVPDPATYADWFATADERSRRLAVGTRRYSAAREALGGEHPSYEHFVDPDDENGNLMSVAQLGGESPESMAARLDRVGSLIAERRQLIRHVHLLGLFG